MPRWSIRDARSIRRFLPKSEQLKIKEADVSSSEGKHLLGIVYARWSGICENGHVTGGLFASDKNKDVLTMTCRCGLMVEMRREP